jgi:hypothetical protein
MIANFGFIVAGLVAGLLFFGLLRWNTALYVGGSHVGTAAAVHVLRLAGVAGLLTLTALVGALPLLLTALGLLIARPLAMRWMP